MLDFLAQYDITMHFEAFVLGVTRLTVFAIVAPFMGNTVLNMTVRSAVVLALYLVLHPLMLTTLPVSAPMAPSEVLFYMGLLLKEVFIGLVLGWLSGLVFWAVESLSLIHI